MRQRRGDQGLRALRPMHDDRTPVARIEQSAIRGSVSSGIPGFRFAPSGLQGLGDCSYLAHLRDVRIAVAVLAQHLVGVLTEVWRWPWRNLRRALDAERAGDDLALAVRRWHDRTGVAHLLIVHRLVDG